MRRRALRRSGFGIEQRDLCDDLSRLATMLRVRASFVDFGNYTLFVGKCERCGRVANLYWCHIVTRAKWSVRWDEDNTRAWCAGCHRHMDHHWEEKQAWMIEKIGQERFDILMMRSRYAKHPDLKMVEVELKVRIKNLNGGTQDVLPHYAL